MNTKVTKAMNHGTGYKTSTFAGGIVGLVSYLAIGLLPSIVYGGFAGVTLAAALFGSPVNASWMARGVVVFGMVIGLLSTAALFVVVGAALGAGLYLLARSFVLGKGLGKETAEAKNNE